jgi:protein-S-isoprenylcysteine O-methyltransferase Ste14
MGYTALRRYGAGMRGYLRHCARPLPTRPVLFHQAEAKQLVSRGLYSKIRNPIYVFGAVLFVGFALVLQKPILWVILPVMVVAQTIRARREARVLEAAFGDAYRTYRQNTWF